MKTAVIFLLFLFQLVNITAQESALKKIKDLYYKANADNYQSHMVSLNTMRAAIGLQTTKINFYYESEQANPDESSYKLDYHLVKIVVSYNVAASMDYRIEYLFDENENLVFYFRKAEGMWENSTLRYYLDKNELIKVDSKSINELGESVGYTSLKNFKQADINIIKQYIEKSKKYLAFFNQMIEIESFDK